MQLPECPLLLHVPRGRPQIFLGDCPPGDLAEHSPLDAGSGRSCAREILLPQMQATKKEGARLALPERARLLRELNAVQPPVIEARGRSWRSARCLCLRAFATRSFEHRLAGQPAQAAAPGQQSEHLAGCPTEEARPDPAGSVSCGVAPCERHPVEERQRNSEAWAQAG